MAKWSATRRARFNYRKYEKPGRFTAKERASYRAGYDAGWLAAHQKIARSYNKARRSR